jgi:Protein of unknown function (DUF1302)
MGSGTRGRSFARELVRLAAALALVMAAFGLYGSDAFANDLAAQSIAPGETVGGAIGGNVLAQTNTLSQPRESWLSQISVSGFANQRAGMWLNPTALQDFTPSRNNLATARTWLQTDINWSPTSDNQFFLRTWFVYEPPYSFNSANNHVYLCHNGLPDCGNTANLPMYRLNDFYNQYTVRDAWWKLTTGPLTLYLGNQIVVWGQSLAFRVGDVINPQDTTWAFGFANLEQSRVPQWMIHPILNLPDLGPLNSNFVEGVLIPGAQPIWNSNRYPDFRFDGESDTAGRVNVGFPAATHAPSGRFDVHYDNQWYPGRNVVLDGWSPYGPFGPGGGGLVDAPFAKEFMWCTQLNPALAPIPGNNAVPASMRRPCDLSGTEMAGGHPVSGPVVIGNYRVPAVSWTNMEEGARLHTLWGSNEITFLYFNTFQYNPTFHWIPFTNIWSGTYEPVQYAGVTLDRPIPVPASLAEYLPLIGRAEVSYANHEPYEDMSPFDIGSVKYSDTVRWMAALDVDQAYSPWLTTTGNLSANLEVMDQIPMDLSKTMQIGPNGADLSKGGANMQKNTISMLFNVATSWWWNAFSPNFTGIYMPEGNTFALFPGVQLNPPWTNKYFARLDFIDILGSNNQSPLGLLKGQGMVLLTAQYNFIVM